MATASNDKTLKIFNNIADLTEPPITFTDNEGWVLVISFSNDGRMLLSGSYEGTQNLVGRPSHADYMVSDICTLVSRNMTQDEWNTYVARDIPLEKTCSETDYNIKVNVIK
jgi:WD40 repeat protein